MALEADGWTVIEAADARVEAAALEESHVELCVMDAHLPGHGLATRLAAVRGRRPDAAVLILSGDPDVVAPDLVQLQKPVDLACFRAGVAHALDIATRAHG